MPKKLTYEYVKNFIENEGYVLLSKEYKDNRTKLSIRCSEGHEYEAKFNDFQQGGRCPMCNHIRAGDLRRHSYDYVKNFIENEGYTLLSQEYKNNRTKLSIRCSEGHEYKVKFNVFQQGSRCPYCNRIKNGDQCRHSYEHVKNHIENEGYALLSQEYKNINTKLLIRCKNKHKYKVAFTSFQQGRRCPYCIKTTVKEQHCRTIFEELFQREFPRCRPDWIRNPKTNRCLELDGYNPELKMAFEYQGEQHYKIRKSGYYRHSFPDIRYRDQQKLRACIKRSVFLLIIPYTISYAKLKPFIEQSLRRYNYL